MAIDPITGLDDGQDFAAQVAQATAQARAAGIPIASAMPGGPPAPVDPMGVQRAAAQARGQGIPPMLASPAPQGPGLGGLAPGQPAIFSMFPPQPARKEVERSTTSTTSRPMGKQEQAAFGQALQGYDAQIEAQGRVNAAQANTAIVEADNADALAAQREARALKRAELVAQGEAQLKDAMTLYKQQFDKYRAMDIKDYFADGNTMKHLAAGLAVALGELGKMRPGGENVAIGVVQQAIQQDFLKQKMAIEKQRDVLLQAGEQMETVGKWHTYAMNALELKEAAAYDAVIARNTANLKAAGVPEAEAQADANNALLRTQKAEKIQKVFESTRQQVSNVVERQMVESEGMAGMGGLTPYQQYQAGRQQREDAEKDQKRVVPGWDGKTIGMAADETEARNMRASLGPSRNIVSQLDDLSKQVEELGFFDRLAPGWSAKQQQIAGKLDTMLGPMTQVLGAGTPQEAEAKRKLQALSSSIMQDPATAKANIADLQGFLRQNYEEQARAKVPGYTPPPAAGQAQRKQGKDGKWYIKTPSGWEPE